MSLKITEKDSHYRNIEAMSVAEILQHIHHEDLTAVHSIGACIPQIEMVIKEITTKLKSGGRLFYLGAGTSGRLGVVDASECPPTFGVPHELVIALIAGGDQAIRKAVENAEDDQSQGWKDLQEWEIDQRDFVIGIAASGSTPYVVSALEQCKKNQIATACITNNPESPITKTVDFPIVCVVGPEFITGSTRMKSGTSQKLILNMISTSVMIGLGRIQDNKMVDMKLNNQKLRVRGINMICNQYPISKDNAANLLEQMGSVRKVLQYLESIL